MEFNNSENLILFKNIFEYSPDPVVISDASGNILEINEMAWKFFGFDSKESAIFKIRNIFQLVHEKDLDKVKKNLSKLLSKGFSEDSIYRIYDIKGNLYYIEIHGKVFYDLNNKPLYIISTLRDVTKYFNMEEKLIKSEIKYKELFNFASDAILILEKDIIFDCNIKAIELFGCKSKDEIIGKSPYFFSPEYQEDGRDSKEKAIEKINYALTGNSQIFEWQHKKVDGKIIDTEVSLNTHYIDDKITILAIIRDISQRKKAENQLKDYQKILENIIEDIPDPAFVIDKYGKVLFWNKAIENLSGIKSEDITGKANYEYSIPFYKKRRPMLIDLVIKYDPEICKNYSNLKIDADVITAEFYIDNFFGKRIYLWGKAKPLYDNQNNIIGAIEIIRDITELKEKELALIESEEKFRQIFNSTTDSIQIDEITDEEAKIIDCNITTLNLYGYDSIEEITSLNISDLSANIYPYTEENALKKIKDAIKGNIPNFEWLAKKKNGELFWVDVTLKKICLSGKDRLLAVVRDIDKRKNIEKKLLENEKNLNAILHAINDAVISIDSNGVILFANESTEKITGFSLNEISGKKFNDIITIMDKIDGSSLINPIEEIQKKAVKDISYYDKILISKDNERKNIEITISKILDENEKSVGAVVVLEDISEKLKFLEQLQTIKRLESLGLLAAGIAHDFNNILEGVYGYIDLAINSEDKEEITNLLKESLNSLYRAKGLTNQLLTFSKGGEPKKKIQSIDNILKEVINFTASGSRIKISYNIDENLSYCLIDEAQISQVFQNITINAIQAMPESGHIIVNAKNVFLDEMKNNLLKGKFIKIEIIDSGKGIPQNIISKVFDPFFTTKEKGHGLGLSICHSIITQHDGYIEVESKENIGTKFSIFLPAIEKDLINQKIVFENKNLNGKRIFVLDDDIVLQNVLKKMLEKLGCEVTTCEDGEKAIKTLYESNNKFDALIFDLTLKGSIDGQQVIKEIRKIDQDILAFVMSGYSEDNIIANPVEYGFTDSINKPFTFEQLKQLLFKYF
ncbi:MAG: PAS domain S-box protein [Exilispira sp.]